MGRDTDTAIQRSLEDYKRESQETGFYTANEPPDLDELNNEELIKQRDTTNVEIIRIKEQLNQGVSQKEEEELTNEIFILESIIENIKIILQKRSSNKRQRESQESDSSMSLGGK